MRATGVVRRIDDLGRVVIPKEVRRTLRIRDGDPLEIFVDRDGEVILKRYAPVATLEEFAKEYAVSLFENLGYPVLVADTRELLAVAGYSKKEKGKELGAALEEAMLKGELVVLKNVSVVLDGTPVFAEVAVAPVVAGDNIVGCIAVATKETIKEEALKAIEVAARFLGKRMLH